MRKSLRRAWWLRDAGLCCSRTELFGESPGGTGSLGGGRPSPAPRHRRRSGGSGPRRPRRGHYRNPRLEEASVIEAPGRRCRRALAVILNLTAGSEDETVVSRLNVLCVKSIEG